MRAAGKSISKGRSSDTSKVATIQAKLGSAGKEIYPDYLKVPDYYKVDIPKKVEPVSITTSPGIYSL